MGVGRALFSSTGQSDGTGESSTTLPAPVVNSTGTAVVYQLDFGGQGATTSTLNGVSYPGTWNNLSVVQ